MFEIYFLLAFRALGFSMIGIFLPLYFLQELGFSLSHVIYFFLVTSIVFGIGSLVSLRVISRYGAKHAMVWSYVFLIIGFLLVLFLEEHPSLYLFAASLQGLSMGMFWMGFHIDVAMHSQKKNTGKTSGLISFSSVLGAILGPLLGGILLAYFSFAVLFLVAVCLFAVSILPLLFSKDLFVKTDFNMRSLFVKDHVKYFLGYFAQGVRFTAGGVFWPIFIFFIFGSYLTLGGYATLTTLVVGVLGFFVGELSDRTKKGGLIKIAAPFEALLWFLTPFVKTPAGVYAVGLGGGIVNLGVDIPLLAKTYSRTKKEDVAAFIFFRETSIRIGEIFALLLVLVTGVLVYSFYASGFASLLYLFF